MGDSHYSKSLLLLRRRPMSEEASASWFSWSHLPWAEKVWCLKDTSAKGEKNTKRTGCAMHWKTSHLPNLGCYRTILPGPQGGAKLLGSFPMIPRNSRLLAPAATWSHTTGVTEVTAGQHPLPWQGWKKAPTTAAGWVTQPGSLSREVALGEKIAAN